MKKCIYCNLEKADGEYYTRPHSTLLNSACKECMKQKSREAKNIHKSPESELWLVQELLRRRIPAMHGKHFKCFSWVDVVAFGMVTIDVKISKFRKDGYYYWGFTPSQLQGENLADIMALVEDNVGGRTVHFIERASPVFSHSENVKKGVVCFPMRWNNAKSQLTQAIISSHTDNWDLITQVLNRKLDQI